MNFIVYMLRFKTSGKIYVGYTNQGLAKRLNKHSLNANMGLKTKLYYAIRKYGLGDIESKILHRCDSKKEATDYEIFYISHYDSYKTGYNMTKGGDGGWCVQDKEEWLAKRPSTKGTLNPRHSGYTDLQILLAAEKYYNDCGPNEFSIRSCMIHIGNLGYPKNFSSCRFAQYEGPSTLRFKKALANHLGVDEEDLNFTTPQKLRSQASERFSGTKWYHNPTTKQNRQLREQAAGWLPGRVKFANH